MFVDYKFQIVLLQIKKPLLSEAFCIFILQYGHNCLSLCIASGKNKSIRNIC